MENMDKGLTVPKWVLIKRPKIPQMAQNLSAQIVCRRTKLEIRLPGKFLMNSNKNFNEQTTQAHE